MALQKNKGPMLTSEFFGEVELLPREYRAKIGTRKTDQQVPIDILPDLLVNPLVQSQVVQTRTDERLKTNIELIGDIATTLNDEVYIPETCQIGHHTRQLVPEGTPLDEPDCTWRSGEQHNLGNGFLDQSIVKVDELFQEFRFKRERPIVTPEDFRAKTQEFEQAALICGTGTPPPAFTPGDGLISQEVHQVDACKFRATQRATGVDVPDFIINFDTNRFKQVEQVARFLIDDTTTPALPTATRDTSFTKLGDGTALEVVKDVDHVFVNRVSSTELLDLLPDIFKAVLPIHRREFTVEDDLVDDPPILGAGEFSRTEEQIDEFNKRVSTRGRESGSTPPVVLLRHIGGERFGGEVTKITGTLDDIEPLVETGVDVVSSEVTNLGNGTWFRQTEDLNTALFWPILVDDIYDEETQSRTIIEKQVVDPTYVPATPGIGDTFVESLKAIDKWHSQRIKVTKDLSSHNSPGTALISYRYHPFQFPGTLDYGRLITFDHREGYRKASALLAKHTVRTWWIESVTPPTVGNTDLGSFDIDVKEIITDTVNVPVYRDNDTTGAETFTDVLHDDITNSLGAFYPATTPSFTQYYRGTASGTPGSASVFVLTAPGTGYSAGVGITVCGHACIILAVGVSNSILGISQPAAPPSNAIITGATNAGPCSVSGGGGTGAAFDELVITYDVPIPGSGWVGTEKVIAAVIKQTEIPTIWKVETESVVMR